MHVTRISGREWMFDIYSGDTPTNDSIYLVGINEFGDYINEMRRDSGAVAVDVGALELRLL